MNKQMSFFDVAASENTPQGTSVPKAPYTLNPDGWSVKGCTIIYAPRGQAGEYSKLATNPYRGCGHKCAYCLDGDTLIQMADGTTKRLRHIEVGDAILGVVFKGNNRAWNTRITTTTVLAKVRSVKDAYKVTLADGTEVVCSADHRWLTERGWKYTANLPHDEQRPSLTAYNIIRKLAPAVETPLVSDSYKTGYLAGMISGDANLAKYDYSDRKRPSGKTAGVQHRFRLALKDSVAIERTKQYLADLGIETTPFDFNHDGKEPLAAIGTTSPEKYAKIRVIADARDGDDEWCRGWLAGIFDAEGSHGKQSLRIHNGDESILSATEMALTKLGFEFVRENRPNHVSAIRLVGGRDKTTPFWQLVNPCISRKFNLEGSALRGGAAVFSVVPMSESREMFDIMTGTENFIANGLVSHNCYVPKVLRMSRPDFDAGAEPRVNFLQQLEKDARKYQAMGITEQVMLSFTTDPFHPYDNSLTRDVLIALQDHGLGICTLTKGGQRALRDLDLFRPDRDAFASTLTSLDDEFSLKWERGAALPGDRIATLKSFHDAGIFTWVSLEPTLDTESSLAIIEHTHEFVDLFKIGRANYLPMTDTTDWKSYTHRILELVNRLGVKHYIKKDLQKYLPDGYPNPKYIPQHN